MQSVPDSLIQIVDASLASAAARSGPHLACRPGCSQCCYGVFEISGLDADRLRDGLRFAEPAVAARLLQRVAAAKEKLAPFYPGDTVIVPKAGIIYVLGDVNRPGGYYMQRDSKLSVLQALGLAGGLQMTAAAPSSRLVRRDATAPNGYVDIKLQLRAIQNGKQKDMALQADDVIYVPFSYARNFLIQGNAILASATSAIIYTHP